MALIFLKGGLVTRRWLRERAPAVRRVKQYVFWSRVTAAAAAFPNRRPVGAPVARGVDKWLVRVPGDPTLYAMALEVSTTHTPRM